MIYRKILESLRKGHPCVLATVIRQAGPSPRGVGAQCLIFEDGTSVGTVGGGILEARTIHAAGEVLRTELPRRLPFTLKGVDVAETDMLCGGEVEVLLEPWGPDDRTAHDLAQALCSLGRKGAKALLATRLDEAGWHRGRLSKTLLGMDGTQVGSLGEGLDGILSARSETLLKDPRPRVFLPETSDMGDWELFLEPVIGQSLLFVFGGGHVSQQIVPACRLP